MRRQAAAIATVILIFGAQAAATHKDETFDARADLGDALVNQANLTQAALSGHLSAANCQLLVAAGVVIGASAIVDALSLVEDDDNITLSETGEARALHNGLVTFANSTSTCSHEVDTIYLEISQEDGWGEPPTVEDDVFWEPDSHPLPGLSALDHNITLNATASMSDGAANNATIRILAGDGIAGASCQLLVAADVVLASVAVIGLSRSPAHASDEGQALQRSNNPGSALATCTQHVRAAEIVLPR